MGSFERKAKLYIFVKGFVKKETDGGFSIKIPTVICCGSEETGAIKKFVKDYLLRFKQNRSN